MALTIAVGFVVDDAIVVLENIVRYVERGVRPYEAAFKGAQEISFTVLSISISLVAVFIPLLLMGGIMGRLFREFAMTVTMTIAVSAFVALTLTPMLASRFLRDPRSRKHNRLYEWSERAFDALIDRYARGLDVVLRHQFATLMVFLATVALTVILFIYIPKGFFPQQDTGLITGISEASQDISFQEMLKRQEELGKIVASDPAVDTIAMAIGAGGSTAALNNGRMYITLKPQSERTATAFEVIRRLQPKLNKLEGIRLFLNAAQDVRVGSHSTRTQFQYTLQGADSRELNAWAPKLLEKLETLPELRDVATDQQAAGTTLTVDINRDQASRFGLTPEAIDNTLYDAFGQRQIAQYYTQQNSYHVIMEAVPEIQSDPQSLDKLYIRSPVTGGLVPLATFASWTTRETQPISISHQGQFPAVTISFNLAPGESLGEAADAIKAATRELRLPASLQASIQGNAQAFQESLVTIPLLIVSAVFVVYLILGILYESYIHPLTILSTLPSAGAGALATLMLFGFDFSLVAMIGVILLIGIVKKNGIILVDFAINAERTEHLSPEDAIRKASLLRFRPIMMTTLAALLGGVPLMLGTGTGAEIRQPLGYAMVGGLAVSQALTLFTTPVIYLYLDRFANWVSKFASSPASSSVRTEAPEAGE
jgi:HAE1 family hydrophobic/amphiphilic exporter-1